MLRYSVICSGRTKNAVFTKLRTAARPGTTSSSSTKTPVLPILLWIHRTTRRFTLRLINVVEPHGDSTVAVRDPESGRQPTPARRGVECRAADFRKACWEESESMSHDRIPMFFMRRLKSGPAPAQVVKNRRAPVRLLRLRRPPRRRLL